MSANVLWESNTAGRPELSLSYRGADFVDSMPYVYRELGLSKQAISYRIPDHYPLWTEFGLSDS